MTNALFTVIAFYHPRAADIAGCIEISRYMPVVVVDNTPPDKRSGYIKQLAGKNIIYHPVEVNCGFATASNIGWRIGFAAGGKWGMVLTQDLRIGKIGIKVLQKARLRLPPCVCGPDMGKLDRRRWTTILGESDPDNFYINGSCIVIHEQVFARLLGFYEPYFMYYEDVDLCVRARRAGIPVKKLPDLSIKHEAHSLARNSFLHQYYLARNHLLFVGKLAPVWVRLYELARLPKTVLEHIYRGEKGGLAGVRDFLLGKAGVYQEKIWS